jgi:hypothetical protein
MRWPLVRLVGIFTSLCIVIFYSIELLSLSQQDRLGSYGQYGFNPSFKIASDERFLPSMEETARMETVDPWRSSEWYKTIHRPGYRPKAVQANKFESYGQYMKQAIVSDYAQGSDKLFLMIKTGGSVLWNRLPVHLFTTLTRVPNFALYSDAPGSIGGYEVIDILANLSDSTLNSNEFTMYRHQRLIHDGHGNINYQDDTLHEGWNLDKFKNIPMLAHAYSVSPDSDWFVFMDADTYLMMDNLMSELGKLDPNEHLYMGTIAGSGKYAFVHGGSGVVISRKTMEESFGKNPGLVTKYEKRTFDECCGDLMVGFVFIDEIQVPATQHLGIQGSQYWNMNLNEERWCEPMLSFHHMNPHDIEVFWEYERVKRLQGTPILYADIYNDFVLPYIEPEITDWDSTIDQLRISHKEDQEKGIKPLSEGGPVLRPYENVEACRKYCQDMPQCLSYRLNPNEKICYVADYVRLGRPAYEWQTSARKDNVVGVTSGWMIDRIRGLRERAPCDSMEEPRGMDRTEGWYRRQSGDAFRWKDKLGN